MAYSLPVELWRVRVVACLPLPDAASLHSTSRALGTSIVNVALLLERIDALLARQLTGVIGVDRTYAPLPPTSLLALGVRLATSLLRCYVCTVTLRVD
mmetsp:Transcript_8995/g.22082  ORF Transcript_8995/g.22082 Transcript_8995/m.22082 type:complete len:98 (-) Transcript_8995:1026-1319(-)